MRTIKFRAWFKVEKAMMFEMENMYDSCLEVGSEKVAYCFSNFGDVLRSDDIELMQFTGLKDKNGKEICEGDICRVIYKNDGETRIVRIYWCSDECGFGREEIDGWDVMTRYGAINPKLGIWEIIGNVWENPELLKDKVG